jgi:hypothetical protein
MIVNQSFLKKFIILWLICNYQWGLSQLNYTTSFNGCNSATCNGWTISGSIVEDADVVELIYRPEKYGIIEDATAGRSRHAD